MLDRLRGFEWDVYNIYHVALHDVTPAEVEEATAQRHLIIPAAPKNREKRWKLFGKTAGGRYLVVVFTIRLNKMRTVTAYTMNRTERKLYAPQIDA